MKKFNIAQLNPLYFDQIQKSKTHVNIKLRN